MTKPVIGIVATHSPLHKINRPGCLVTHISDEIRQALIDNDAIPIGILPPCSGANFIGPADLLQAPSTQFFYNLLDQLHLCDGIVFQGGKCLDDFAFHIARIAYDERIPTLGVCGGQTIMASIFSDTVITSADPLFHNNITARYMHETYIDPRSAFYQIVQCETMSVNSRHNHAVQSCPQLQVAATSPASQGDDRHIEVLEAPDRFYLSTRFHPESLYQYSQNINAIFEALVSAASKYHDNPSHI